MRLSTFRLGQLYFYCYPIHQDSDPAIGNPLDPDPYFPHFKPQQLNLVGAAAGALLHLVGVAAGALLLLVGVAAGALLLLVGVAAGAVISLLHLGQEGFSLDFLLAKKTASQLNNFTRLEKASPKMLAFTLYSLHMSKKTVIVLNHLFCSNPAVCIFFFFHKTYKSMEFLVHFG